MKLLLTISMFIASQLAIASNPPTIKISQKYGNDTLVYIECFESFPITFRAFQGNVEIWQKKLLYNCTSSLKAAASESHIFFVTQDKVVLAVSLATGDVDWATPLPPSSSSVADFLYLQQTNEVIAVISKDFFFIGADTGIPNNQLTAAFYPKSILPTKNGFLMYSSNDYKIYNTDAGLTTLNTASVSYTYYPELHLSPAESKVIFMRKGYNTGQIFDLKTLNHECTFSQSISYSDPVTYVPLDQQTALYASFNFILAVKDDCSVKQLNLKKNNYYRVRLLPLGTNNAGELAFARIMMQSSTSQPKDIDLVYVDAANFTLVKEVALQTQGQIAEVGESLIFDSVTESLTYIYTDLKTLDSRVATAVPK